MACWSTKETISLKRVKIEEKLLIWRAYWNSPTFFRTVPSPTPYGVLFPKFGGSQPTQNFNRYYLRNGQSYELQILYAHSYDRSEHWSVKISGKVVVGVLRNSRKFLGHPFIGRTYARSSLQQLGFLVIINNWQSQAYEACLVLCPCFRKNYYYIITW